jgi:hypothetical protein
VSVGFYGYDFTEVFTEVLVGATDSFTAEVCVLEIHTSANWHFETVTVRPHTVSWNPGLS